MSINQTQSEAAEQRQFFAWARKVARRIEPLRYLHASLNGVKLSPGLAKKMKAQGMEPGVPDIFLPVPVGGYHGLWIELKKADGKTSQDQDRWLSWLQKMGYRATVARGWVKAKQIVEEYLAGGVRP